MNSPSHAWAQALCSFFPTPLETKRTTSSTSSVTVVSYDIDLAKYGYGMSAFMLLGCQLFLRIEYA